MFTSACRKCKRLFQSPFENKMLCPTCEDELEDQFQRVRDYLWENNIASVYEVSQACDVSEKQLVEWAREERLSFAEGKSELVCDNCKKPILSGKYCPECKAKIKKDLNSVKVEKNIQVVYSDPKRQSDRMRFLDK